MSKNENTEESVIGVESATIEQLKVAGFDIDQQIKLLQSQYQTILNELKKRFSSKDKSVEETKKEI